MSFDDLEPRRHRGDAIAALIREDLSFFGVDELESRIELLKSEIERVEAQIRLRQGTRNEAEALFRK